jgi:hypothetical protein
MCFAFERLDTQAVLSGRHFILTASIFLQDALGQTRHARAWFRRCPCGFATGSSTSGKSAETMAGDTYTGAPACNSQNKA